MSTTRPTSQAALYIRGTGSAHAFPVLFATDEVAGIYNIIYRHMFDRRRDLGIPTSFLLDKDGMIVKVYQGDWIPST